VHPIAISCWCAFSPWLCLQLCFDYLVLLVRCCCYVDINACEAFRCTDGAGFAQCQDISAAIGGRNNTQGRTCTCRINADVGAALNEAQYYANDTAGCIGKPDVI
jgi:hypothetical protein